MTGAHGPHISPDSGSLTVSNDREEIDRVMELVLDAVDRHGYEKASKFAIRLALQEAIANAFNHGHRTLAADVPVTVYYDVQDALVVIAVEDRGPGFNPGSVPDPTLEENLERPTGRGIMLMRAYMSEVSFNDRGNRVEMRYRRPPSAKSNQGGKSATG